MNTLIIQNNDIKYVNPQSFDETGVRIRIYNAFDSRTTTSNASSVLVDKLPPNFIPYQWIWNGEKPVIKSEFYEEYMEKLKSEKIALIDSETSSAILSGFTYTIKDKERFFSYDSFDQQNFVDTASGAILSQVQSSTGIPTTVNWNSYVGEEKTLEVITLNATEFLDLYINGALVHKNTQMSIGSQRKLQVKEAQSWEEIDAI